MRFPWLQVQDPHRKLTQDLRGPAWQSEMAAFAFYVPDRSASCERGSNVSACRTVSGQLLCALTRCTVRGTESCCCCRVLQPSGQQATRFKASEQPGCFAAGEHLSPDPFFRDVDLSAQSS